MERMKFATWMQSIGVRRILQSRPEGRVGMTERAFGERNPGLPAGAERCGELTNSFADVALEARKLRLDHHPVAEFRQGFVLDLADALAGEADALADFFQRHRVFAFKAVAELEDFRGPLVDVFQQRD